MWERHAGEKALRVGKLSDAAQIASEIQQWIDSVREDYNRQTEAKANCDRLSQEVLHQSTQIKPFIESAQQAIDEIIAMNPKISVTGDRQQCDSFLKVLSNFPAYQELIQSNYNAQKYEIALRVLKDRNQKLGLTLEHLSYIIAKHRDISSAESASRQSSSSSSSSYYGSDYSSSSGGGNYGSSSGGGNYGSSSGGGYY